MIRNDWDDLAENGQRGDWYFHQDDTYITIRYGDDRFDVVSIPIARVHDAQHWQWDGNKEAPTISPSILIRGNNGAPDKWHGWLRDGKVIDA